MLLSLSTNAAAPAAPVIRKNARRLLFMSASRTARLYSPRRDAGACCAERYLPDFALRSPVKSHSGGTGRWNRYRAPPWPPFDLSATNLRRLGRTLSPEDTAPRFAPARGPDAVRSGGSEFRREEPTP